MATARTSAETAAEAPEAPWFKGRAPRRPFSDPGSSIREWLGEALAREGERRSGFFLAPLGLMVGIAAFYGADLRLDHAATLAGIAVSLLALLSLSRRPLLRALVFTVLFTLVGQAMAHREATGTTTTIFSGEATVRVEGRVVWREVDERGRYRYLLDVLSTERPQLSRPPERVRIVVSSRHEPVPIGGVYAGLMRLRPPSGPALPGTHDFAFAPFFSGLGAYGFSLGAPEPAAAVDPADLSFTERVATLRVTIAERIRTVVGGAEGAVASALITGERAGIPEDVNEWLRITGLAHVLSISGFHMALIAGFTMLSVRAIAAAVPGLALRVSTKKIAAVAAFLVSTAYLLIAGDNVATQRSYIMLAIMLGAVMLDRPALTLRNVAIAAIIVITISPHAVLTASFQMSFAATAALVGAFASLMRWWNGRRQHDLAPRRDTGLVTFVLVSTAALALSSLIAGGATTPYGAYHFQRAAPLGGLIANVLVMPLFSFWIMPLCLLCVLVMPLGLDAPLLIMIGHGLTVVFEMARVLAEWFPDHATGPISAHSVVVLTAAILAVCFLASRLRWVAVPLAAVGVWLLPAEVPTPELVVFEDGKQLALIDGEGRLHHLRERPNRFVAGQWERLFPQPALEEATASAANRTFSPFACDAAGVCRATTRSGARVAWTEDYEKTGLLCDSADIAIVSRAIRRDACRSGAHLVTLRTLRRSGSSAFGRQEENREITVETAIGAAPREWNEHRHAPWPEFWRNADDGGAGETASETAAEGAVSSAGSTRPAGPAP